MSMRIRTLERPNVYQSDEGWVVQGAGAPSRRTPGSTTTVARQADRSLAEETTQGRPHAGFVLASLERLTEGCVN